MRTVYIADDGKEFDDEWECKDYEWKLNHHHLNDVRFYDKDEMRLRDIFSEDTYNPELGLAMCIIKKMCDNKGNYNDVFNKWLPKE